MTVNHALIGELLRVIHFEEGQDRPMRAMAIVGIALTMFLKSAHAIEKLECVGTEPFWNAILANDRVTLKLFDGPRNYRAPKYGPAAGGLLDYVMSVRARRGKSNLTAFVVNETQMFVADKNGAAPTDRDGYLAYCSDGMSGLAYHFSIHLLVDRRAYTGCCSTATARPVGHR
jgi:uncharacterized membrane protein